MIIIGAGPSGLALGSELRARGVDFVMLEKGGVGDSWARMPKHLKLVSPWKTNWLTRQSARRYAPHAQLTRSEFRDYLRDFAAEHELPVMTGCEVTGVEAAKIGFRVRTPAGDFSADMVVNATGYFSNPVRPRPMGADATKIPCRHYPATDTPEVIALAGGSGHVLIVGHRLSAGQAALELFDAGLRVTISHRSPIRFGVDDWLWPLVYRAFPLAEAWRLKVSRGRAGRIDVRMAGGRIRRLIRSGAIPTVPAVGRFTSDSVVLADGALLRPDVVLYATGFAPSLGFLSPLRLATHPDTGVPVTCGMESVSVPGLYFLGFEMVRNFQSRFLRGMREDAVVLAGIIQERATRAPLRSSPEACPA